jgi:hypothetical protein
MTYQNTQDQLEKGSAQHVGDGPGPGVKPRKFRSCGPPHWPGSSTREFKKCSFDDAQRRNIILKENGQDWWNDLCIANMWVDMHA